VVDANKQLPLPQARSGGKQPPVRGVSHAVEGGARTVGALGYRGAVRIRDGVVTLASDVSARRPRDGAPEQESVVVAKGKRTFQPNNRRRSKTHGFRLRMRTRAGRAVLASRRRKGRAELSA